MSTSGSTNYNQTRDEIISDALTLLGVYRPGATVTTVDKNFMSNLLNKMLKSWEKKGIHMWAMKEGTLYLRDGVNRYDISLTGTDRAGDDAIETTLTAAASGSSLTVTSTAGMTAGDQIGIELDDDTRQWTTITSVDSSTTLTCTDSVTSAASSGNTVYTYTTHAGKALHISGARFKDSYDNEIAISIIGREAFMQLPNKSQTGSNVIQMFYSPELSSTKVYVWPPLDGVSGCIKYSYARMIEDLDSGTDNPDFPSEWLEPITLNLAVRGAPAYGKRLSAEDPQLIRDAQTSLLEAQLFDGGSGSTKVVPNYRWDD